MKFHILLYNNLLGINNIKSENREDIRKIAR